jgi:4-hydroxy-tetrahydrodipicolinate synthase
MARLRPSMAEADMPMASLPHGIYPYLVSPVAADGRVDEAVLERLVGDLIAAGVDGLTPLGSTGEIMYLTLAQRRAVVSATLRAAGGRLPVVAGVSAFSTHDAVEQARALEQLGVDGLVVMRQQGFPTPEAGVVDYFTEVARAVSCPIVLYTNPAVLGSDLSLDSMRRLAELPNVRYVKDATGDTGRILSILNALDGRLGVFSASAHIPLFVLLLGGMGWMAGPACVIPKAAVELCALVRSGRLDAALKLQRGIWAVNELFRRYPLGACIKAALEIRGYAVGDPIAPQRPLEKGARAEISAALEQADAALATTLAEENR